MEFLIWLVMRVNGCMTLTCLPPEEPEKLEIDPLGGPPKSVIRTVKGSSYVSASLSELRAAFRDGTSEPREELGFRLARYM